MRGRLRSNPNLPQFPDKTILNIKFKRSKSIIFVKSDTKRVFKNLLNNSNNSNIVYNEDSHNKIVFGEGLKKEESDLQNYIKKMMNRTNTDEHEPNDNNYNALIQHISSTPSYTLSPANSMANSIVESLNSNVKKLTNKNLIIEKNRKITKMKLVFDSLSEDENENQVLMRTNPTAAKQYFKENFFLINPDGNFKKRWSFLIVLLILYCVFIGPFRMAFKTSTNETYENFSSAYYIELLVDTFFLLDISINFFLAFYDEEENLIVSNNKIALNYLQGWFIIDLITSIPVSYLNLIIYYYNLDSPDTRRFYIAIKWIKVMRIIKLLYNSSYQDNKVYELFFSEKNSNVAMRYSIVFIVVIHLTTLFWCYLGNIPNEMDQSWIRKANLRNDSNFDIYISSMYYILATIFTIGYGDIKPDSFGERVYILIICLVGVFVFSLAISWLSNRFTYNDKKTIKLEKRLELLEEIKRDYKIPKNLNKEIKTYLETHHNKDVIGRYKFIESLPVNLKNQLVYVMSQNQIKKHKFFHNVNYEFFLFVVPMILTVKFSKNDILFSIGGYVEEMYMVNQGALSLRLGKMYHSIEVAQIGVSQHFGEILMYSSELSNFDFKVKTRTCEVYIIRKNDFTKIKMRFPEIILEKLKMAYKSYHKILLRRKFYIELISNLPTNIHKENIKSYLRTAQKNSMENLLAEKENQNNILIDNNIMENVTENVIENIPKSKNNIKNSLRHLSTINTTTDRNYSHLSQNYLNHNSTKSITVNQPNKIKSSNNFIPTLEEMDLEDKNVIINITNIENNINNHFMMIDKFTNDKHKRLSQIGSFNSLLNLKENDKEQIVTNKNTLKSSVLNKRFSVIQQSKSLKPIGNNNFKENTKFHRKSFKENNKFNNIFNIKEEDLSIDDDSVMSNSSQNINCENENNSSHWSNNNISINKMILSQNYKLDKILRKFNEIKNKKLIII